MNYQYLKVEKKNNVAVVTLNRADRHNALCVDFMDEIIHISESFHQDTDSRVVIFTGAGNNFSVGADLKDRKSAEERTKSLLEIQRALQRGPKMIRSVYEMNQITIAAINGYALGGGACITTACDFRIGASDCEVGYPECNLAMNLNWGALPLCVHLVGPARAKRMVILAQREKANVLRDWGFLDEIVPPDQLMPSAMKMAAAYAKQPPVAAQMIKRSINHIVSALDQAVMHMDKDQFILTNRTEDFIEGISAFLEKRESEFKGN